MQAIEDRFLSKSSMIVKTLKGKVGRLPWKARFHAFPPLCGDAWRAATVPQISEMHPNVTSLAPKNLILCPNGFEKASWTWHLMHPLRADLLGIVGGHERAFALGKHVSASHVITLVF